MNVYQKSIQRPQKSPIKLYLTSEYRYIFLFRIFSSSFYQNVHKPCPQKGFFLCVTHVLGVLKNKQLIKQPCKYPAIQYATWKYVHIFLICFIFEYFPPKNTKNCFSKRFFHVYQNRGHLPTIKVSKIDSATPKTL